MVDGFHLFRPLAERALALAREEALRRRHAEIGSEHLLLALLAEPDSVCGLVLRELGIDHGRLRADCERVSGEGEGLGYHDVDFTASVRRAIELAVQEVHLSSRSGIGTGDLLLGLLREGKGVAGQLLVDHGVSLERTRELVAKAPPEADEHTIDAAGPSQREEGSRGGPNRLGGFSVEARRVLTLAQEEAARWRHNYIGTEHMLLALLRLEKGVAAKALAALGVDPRRASAQLNSVIRPGSESPVGNRGLTECAKKTVERAVHQARLRGHRQVGTGHLLLGLVESGGVAGGLLENLGIDLKTLQEEVTRHLEGWPFAE